MLARRGWARAFVKLSTRSAKDAPQILDAAIRDVDLAAPPEARVRQLAAAVQSHLSVPLLRVGTNPNSPWVKEHVC